MHLVTEQASTSPSREASPHVLIVCEHASFRFGGEAALPLHYFLRLRSRGIEAWLITHSRTRDEISERCGIELDRVAFVADTAFNRMCWRLESRLPSIVSHFTIGFLSRVATQLQARRLARSLVLQERVTIVHQPIPVSPREPSFMYDMGCPVIIGPMNGNMAYPDAFAPRGPAKRIKAALVRLSRTNAELAHVAIPGKLKSAALLYANDRTGRALPGRYRGERLQLHENAVDLSLWRVRHTASDTARTRFISMGRMVDFKVLDIAIAAFARMRGRSQATLEIIGSGPQEASLRKMVADLGMEQEVTFSGWLPQEDCARKMQEADVFLMPSVRECGGAVVLEAMACGIPVIATNWGGPADYVDTKCGILVEPNSRDSMVDAFAKAMAELARDPALRQQLGQAARQRIVDHFDWDRRIDEIITIYERHQSTGVRR